MALHHAILRSSPLRAAKRAIIVAEYETLLRPLAGDATSATRDSGRSGLAKEMPSSPHILQAPFFVAQCWQRSLAKGASAILRLIISQAIL